MTSTPHVQLAVIDPARVTLSGAPASELRSVVGRDGEVSGVRTLEDMSRAGDVLHLPVCYRYHRRSGCSVAELATPMDNVRLLREREQPDRAVGAFELVFAAGLVTAGVLGERGETQQSTSGPGILITSGAIVAIVGAIEAFRPAGEWRTVVGPRAAEHDE
jgi:hypothetical protein